MYKAFSPVLTLDAGFHMCLLGAVGSVAGALSMALTNAWPRKRAPIRPSPTARPQRHAQ